MDLKTFIEVIFLIIFFIGINDLFMIGMYLKEFGDLRTDLKDSHNLMQQILDTSKEINTFCLNQYTFIDDKVEEMDAQIKKLIEETK